MKGNEIKEMTEEIKGLHVKDYHDLDVQALEEIIQLDNQLEENLKQIKEAVIKRKRIDAMRLLDMLLTDNASHRNYCIECQGDILSDMYEEDMHGMIDYTDADPHTRYVKGL